MSLSDFVAELGSDTPAPGGGSAAALCGALGAALSAMVSRLTLGRQKYRDAWQSMEKVQQGSEHLSDHFLWLVQEDTDAYNEVLAAVKLPKETEEQKTSRNEALQAASKRAAEIPLYTLRAAEELVLVAKEAVERGNPNTFTDAGAAVQLARTAAIVASYNVQINLPGIRDKKFVEDSKREVEETLFRINSLSAEVNGYVNIQLHRALSA
jgi:glutamate formiminotransferase/formiminotetrahydrofolate cyclodeaminase